jgi:uncharacterized membrane protein YbhN (UPF0104 family)
MKSWTYKLISLTLLAIILFALSRYWEDVRATLYSVELHWFFLGIFFYGTNYLLRAFRLYQFLGFDPTIRLPTLMKSSGLHGFYNYFMPLRSGDAALPFLLKTYCSLTLFRGLQLLIRARLQDFISLGLIICLVALFSRLQLPGISQVYFFFFGAALCMVPYIIIYAVRNKSSWLPHRLTQKFPEEPPHYPRLAELVTSLSIWLCTGTTLYCVVQSLKIPLHFKDIWVLISVQLPLQVLPVQGLANSGNHELGWVGALKLLGIGIDSGMNYALSSHIILVIYVLILGIFAFLLPPIRPDQSG